MQRTQNADCCSNCNLHVSIRKTDIYQQQTIILQWSL